MIDVSKSVAGLRELADFIEQHPQFVGALDYEKFHCFVGDEDEFTALVSELGGKRTKEASNDYFGVSRFFGPIEMYVYTNREQVCTATVVGTETVTVRDPNAPLVEIERDIVEWECGPVLKRVTA